ncbi:MAG TPA: D-alanine--D-alanine ligase family protein [Methylomirabilota bacterium]|jgi:D-alanine-D-alanine ligase|nr:D-alanine--D-alanine ligase family protein [Methylomirabilota bacterium]
MARKTRVGIVFGGRSGEHEVSLAGAASVIAAIDRSRFEVVPIGIAKDGRWLVGGDPLRALSQEATRLALAAGGAEGETKRELVERAAAVEAGSALARTESSEGLPPGLRTSLDVMLIMLHGPQGEDGTIQGLLELAGIPYTGAGVLASAVGMDKGAMKDMFRAHGLPVVEYAVIRRHDWRRDAGVVERAVGEEIGFPCFVKPANLGSSVGVSKVKAAEDLAAAVERAAGHDRRILVERAVQGREVEVAVLGNDTPMASVPGEICYAGEWYDYETKYGAGQTTFKVPAALPPATTELVRSLAIRAFQAVDGAGMARVDFFIETDGRVLVNEINTIPGFTQTSAYPRLWEASGIPYPELIARLIDLAIERRR